MKPTVCNPLLRTPLSPIVDDSCPVINLTYYWIRQRHAWKARHHPGEPPDRWEGDPTKLDRVPPTIPSDFARRWGEWCGEQGIRGKFSLVPFPAGQGRIDQGFPDHDPRELDAYDPDGTRTLWMKCSEIGHYWMARELSHIEVAGDAITVRTQFPTNRFTVRLHGCHARGIRVGEHELPSARSSLRSAWGRGACCSAARTAREPRCQGRAAQEPQSRSLSCDRFAGSQSGVEPPHSKGPDMGAWPRSEVFSGVRWLDTALASRGVSTTARPVDWRMHAMSNAVWLLGALVLVLAVRQAEAGARREPIGHGAQFVGRECKVGGVGKKGIFAHPPWKGAKGRVVGQFDIHLNDAKAPELTFAMGILDGHGSDKGVIYRVFAGGKEIWSEFHKEGAWKAARVDLKPFAGKAVALELAVDSLGEHYACWGEPRIVDGGRALYDLADMAAKARKFVDLMDAVPEDQLPESLRRERERQRRASLDVRPTPQQLARRSTPASGAACSRTRG